jgi:hypothetical protein
LDHITRLVVEGSNVFKNVYDVLDFMPQV